MFQKSDVFDVNGTEKICLKQQRLKPNGERLKYLFNTWTELHDHMQGCIIDSNKTAKSSLELFDKTISLFERFLKEISRVDQMSLDEICNVCSLVDEVVIFISHISKVIGSYPRYCNHIRFIPWLLLIKGSLGKDCMSTKELANKILRQIERLNTSGFTDANIRKFKIKCHSTETLVESDKVLNGVLQMFLDFSMYTAGNVFEKLSDDEFEVCPTEDVEDHIRRSEVQVNKRIYWDTNGRDDSIRYDTRGYEKQRK